MSVYLDAIRVLEERGWAQGHFVDEESAVCLRGAIRLALGGAPDPAMVGARTPENVYAVDEAEQRALHVLLDLLAWRAESVQRYNDDQRTAYEDVVLLLKRAHEAVCEAV